MRKILLCLICLAWSLGGCAAVAGVVDKVKDIVGRVEVCVGGVCFRYDEDGDGVLESHIIKDENPDPHPEPEAGPDG